MDTIEVIGPKPLQGTAHVSGSKNASLAILAATLMVEGETVLHNAPRVEDVRTMIEILRFTGARVRREQDGRIVVDATNLTSYRTPYELVRRMRASFYAAGALLSRMNRAEVALPGGCYIGVRPVNWHIDAFQRLGAECGVEHGIFRAKAGKLKGAVIHLDPRFCSVGTTINTMLAAILADGETVLRNASRDPDVVDCANFLTAAGAAIEGIGTSTLSIKGVDGLRGVGYSVVPDRIEAGTLLLAGAVTKGDVTVRPCVPEQLKPLTRALEVVGGECYEGPDFIRVRGADHLHAFDITTGPHPGFSTDLQAPTAVLMCLCSGRSTLEETVFEGRLKYAGELRRMGANIRVMGQTAYVEGTGRLAGAPVEAQDIRAGAALVVAGLAANGRTEVSGAHFIERGYEGLVDKLRGLGALVGGTGKAVQAAAG